MAFGFFKKNTAADLVIRNGKVVTQNADMPDADSIACKDGKIIAVGDYESIEPLINGDTEVVNADGNFVSPGLIYVSERPVMQIFEGKYLDLTRCTAQDEFVSALTEWASSHPDDEMIFGFGYNEDIFSDSDEIDQEKVKSILDSCCSDKPVLLLCRNNVSCIMNTEAAEIVRETAEEEVVQYITLPYILNLFVPFDFEELEQDIAKQLEASTRHGITSILNLGTPDYFETLYQDVLISLYNEQTLNQRFFGSYLINRPLIPKGLIHRLMQRKTICNEIGDRINSNLLYVELDEESCPIDFSQELLDTILEEVASRNFGIYLKAHTQNDLDKAYMTVEHVRSNGNKNLMIIESPCEITEELKSSLMWWESVYKFDSGDDEALLLNAPFIAGADDILGSIEVGKAADIAIFKTNPFEDDIDCINSRDALITIFDGKVVFE